MAIHGAAIIGLGLLTQGMGIQRSGALKLIGGGLGFLAILVLALTSTDRAVRWLGAMRWRALHRAGIHYLWFVFLVSFAPGALDSPINFAATLLLLAAAGLRMAGGRARTIA